MDFSCSTLLCFGVVLGFHLFVSESSPVLVHQSLDCSVVVVICGCESYFLWGGLVVIFCFIVL